MAATALPHLEVEGLGLERNGRWLFRNLSWKIPRGSVVAIVGPSGTGKSSLLRCLAGMLRPQEGRVTFSCAAGCLHEPGDYQPRIGMVFQNYLLSANTSVLRNVLCGRLGRYRWWQTLLRFPRRDREEAWRLLASLGLDRSAHRPVAEISGGEQQRTAILRALFQDPEIVLADEPVSNLDAYLSGRVLGLLRQGAKESRRTVLCVLHDAALVDRFADFALSLNPADPEGWRIRAVAPGFDDHAARG